MKKDKLTIYFEILDLYTKVSSVPQNNNVSVCQWGSISHFNLELQLKKWCENNPRRGDKIRKLLKGLEGPSYDPKKKQRDILQDYRHF